VLAPSSTAFNAAFSRDVAMEVWIPMRKRLMLAGRRQAGRSACTR
jgi:hypothetical protein